MTAQVANGIQHLLTEEVCSFVTTVLVGAFQEADGRQGGVPQKRVRAAVDHVLHDQHAQTITGVIELLRLDFDVLAEKIEAQPFHAKNIALVFLRFSREEDPVGEIALIQYTVKEDRCAVEQNAVDTGFLLDFDRSQSEVAFDAVFGGGDNKRIEMRLFRRPEDRVFNGKTAAVAAEGGLFAVDVCDESAVNALQRDGDAVEVAVQCDAVNVILRHGFQPDALPDAADRRVPHTARCFGLLAVRIAWVQRVSDEDFQLIGGILTDNVADVKAERQIAALMLAEELLVEPNLGDLIHSAEVKQRPCAAELFGIGEV